MGHPVVYLKQNTADNFKFFCTTKTSQFSIQFGGAFMLKAPGYQMVQENSKYDDSYFYQIDHASRKSFFNIFTLGSGVPYMRQEGLPGMF